MLDIVMTSNKGNSGVKYPNCYLTFSGESGMIEIWASISIIPLSPLGFLGIPHLVKAETGGGELP